MTIHVRMTKAEWLARGTELFGADFDAWRFVCPGCGHVQSIADFRPFKDRGATPESARCECIGRYTGGRSWAYGGGPGPCDYAGYGLFPISPVTVIDGEREVRSFHFDDGVYKPNVAPAPPRQREWRVVIEGLGLERYETTMHAETRSKARYLKALEIADVCDTPMKRLLGAIRVYSTGDARVGAGT